MSIFSKQVVVEYSADQMYDLVSDVNSYSSFIPLCTASKIDIAQGDQLFAAFTIAKGPLSFSFTTLNTVEKGKSISMGLESGPFKSFKGTWQFSPLESNKSLISLYMEFEFSNKLLCCILDGLFNQLCELMIQSFRNQAAIIYHGESPVNSG
jgi:ribosome-associated toxin RatA of RatAB toxin-antitoxin module